MSPSNDAANRVDGDVHGIVIQAGAIGGGVHLHQPVRPHEPFTAAYREFTARTLDGFEFFGVDPRGVPRRHRFDAGYVPLTLKERDAGDGVTVNVGTRADQALGQCHRALVRGVAGSGKSTLLRWIGADAARSADADGPVPFILELGRFAGGRPPALADLVAPTLRQGMPTGWVEAMLAGNRAVLLLDGLDEVRPRERTHLEDWVEEHLNLYPGIRLIVTTRPSIVAEQWWVDRDFQRFDLLPMSRYSIERYVHGWHETARADHPAGPAGEAERAELTRCEQGLLATLSNRPALRGMSANPLLCGLLCALHLERGEHLPENRKQIYEAAVDLLLRWRHLRRRRGVMARGALARGDSAEGEPTEGIDSPLNDEELLKLFQRLAFWLVTNRQQVLPPDVAVRRVESYMFGLRHGDADPARVVHYLTHHSGLLREQSDGSLEFLHRTFLDHLAAKEVVEEENLSLMLDNADKPHWHDVVVMAGAHARPGERTRILLELLDRGRADEEHRDALYLLAAAILEQTAVLPRHPQSPDVRAMVTEAMAELVPPRTSAAADQLAAAGQFVLDLLPGPKGLTTQQAELVVRAAARIAAQWNPPGAVEKILQFIAAPTKGMISQLLEVWGRLGDYETYARDVLSEIDLGRVIVDMQAGRRIEHIGHLRTITALVLRNDIFNLRPLADLPRLRWLQLRGNATTDVAPLANAPSLRVLVLDGCATRAGTQPVKLAPLRTLGLRRLRLSGLTTRIDLADLAGFRLDSLCLCVRPHGSRALPADLHVRHLCLAAGGRRTDFTGVRGVRSIVLDWAPDQDELAALAGMPELRRLVVWDVPPGTATPTLPGVEVTVRHRPA
ncbi:NACHT domain-containing protein [Solihabitans fulvus]|uniref:NACHT domain-containing protein n=1 Tax=Solihabitans fulvus TaxID=1892852 RepID=A0A5B2X3Y6_9PSEU|nr:NACHT domain-containing protein [Solihabitans fulvus]KAA2257909.1 NACHT domain-containing protein [Solihabitans fulvus]